MKMKNLLLSAFFALLIVACATKQAKQKKEDSCCTAKTEKSSSCYQDDKKTASCCAGKETETDSLLAVITVDQLLLAPEKYIEKKVDLKGLVAHTCKKSGKKMFLKGENDSVFIRVEAGENISQFEADLEGDSIVATGYINVIALEHKHKNGEACSSEKKSKDYMLTCEEFKTL
ncbi:hypothetical protein E9993_20240 [Labilibacter sediminis]|nr:hypothetical protein E9993_20240 [Labilibacter sediminis]